MIWWEPCILLACHTSSLDLAPELRNTAAKHEYCTSILCGCSVASSRQRLGYTNELSAGSSVGRHLNRLLGLLTTHRIMPHGKRSHTSVNIKNDLWKDATDTGDGWYSAEAIGIKALGSFWNHALLHKAIADTVHTLPFNQQ